MKYSYNILKILIPDLDKIDVNQIKERLSSRLAEVEGIEDLSKQLEGLLVAQVVDIKKHPNFNKLYIVKVDVGNKVIQVVAGAGNIKKGDFVPYTPVGVKVPRNAYPERFDGIVRKIKLAGEVSEGMLNSEFELNISNDHSEILVLNELTKIRNIKPGMELAKALGFDDYLIEIENKALTHRGDVFSHVGLARELATVFKLNFDEQQAIQKYYRYIFANNKLDIKNVTLLKGNQKAIEVERGFNSNLQKTNTKTTSNANLDIHVSLGQVDKDCWRYDLYKIDFKNQINKKSPLAIKLELAKFDIGVVSYIVDVLNLVTLIIGQPMHAFDYHKVTKLYSNNNQIKIGVQYVQDGKLKALDNKEYIIKEKTLCITANNTPIAFAGVIGGLDTAVDENTKTILLEIANFSYSSIRRTMMYYGLKTFASVIYARQQASSNIEKAFNIVYSIWNPTASINSVGSVINKQNVKKTIRIKVNNMFEFLDLTLSNQEIEDILSRLGLRIKFLNNQEFEVEIPEYRLDLQIPEDIYEEIIRIKGYEHIVPKLPKSNPVNIHSDKKVAIRQLISNYFTYRQYIETVGYGFFSTKTIQNYDFDEKKHYKIINAISPEVNYFRSSIYPQLIDRIDVNLQYSSIVRFFETGHVAYKGLESSFDDVFKYHTENVPLEAFHLAGMIASKNIPVQLLAKMLVNDVLQFNKHISIEPLFDMKSFVDNVDKSVSNNVNENQLDKNQQDKKQQDKNQQADQFENNKYKANQLEQQKNSQNYQQNNQVSTYWQEMINPLNKWNSGYIKYKQNVIGIIGTLKSNIRKKVTNANNFVLFELDLLPMLLESADQKYVHNVLYSPAIYEDYSVIVPMDLSYNQLFGYLMYCFNKVLHDVNKQYKTNVLINQELIDIYYPESKNEKYVTFRFYFIQKQGRVLQQLVKKFRQKFIDCLIKQYNIRIKQ